MYDSLFVWKNNSCSYDSILSPLWYIYKNRSSPEERLSFNSVSVLGDVFPRIAGGTIDVAEAKALLSEDVFSINSRFEHGTFLNIFDVISHILRHSRVEDLTSTSDDLCVTKVVRKKICVNPICENFEKEIVSEEGIDVQHYRPAYDHTKGVQSVVDQFWDDESEDHGRSHSCFECKMRARWERDIASTPFILFLAFTKPLSSNLDLTLTFGGHDYDLVAIIYYGHSHYVVRMISSEGMVLEYDGMKRMGRLAEVNSDSPLSSSIVDLTGNSREAISAWYKKRNASAHLHLKGVVEIGNPENNC